MTAKPVVEIGVDVGGTFTDVVCRRPGLSPIVIKVPTTRDDPALGVLASLDRLADDDYVGAQDVARFVHGTTVATNAVIERKGATVGLLTTEGFRDILEIGRQIRHAVYSVILEPETPTFLAPGARRKAVTERIGADGSILIPLDDDSVRRAAAELVEDGVEAIAISFLFSFLNPSHEHRTRDIVHETYPDLDISISSEVDPAFREYERTVVTAFDAYLKPVVDGYLQRLTERLARAGVSAPLQIMQSRGGISSASIARQRPVRLFLSGPAAGVIGARAVGQTAGVEDLITIDIGGTSCDISLIKSGRPMLRSEGSIDGFPCGCRWSTSTRLARVAAASRGSTAAAGSALDRSPLAPILAPPAMEEVARRRPSPMLRSSSAISTLITSRAALCSCSLRWHGRSSLRGWQRPCAFGRASRSRHPPRAKYPDDGGHPSRLYLPGPGSARFRAGLRSAAPGRYMRRRSPENSAYRRSSCRGIRVCSPRSDCLPRRSSTRSRPLFLA